MLYTKKATKLPGAYDLREATISDYISLIPDDIKLKIAEMHLHDCIKKTDAFTSPDMVKKYIAMKIAKCEREAFGVLILDNQHRLILDKVLFEGTINAASVYPRELVKLVLANNGACVLLYHNHPSGDPSPSQADRRITARIKDALDLIDVSVLDHIIVGVEGQYSFVEKGLIRKDN